MVPSGVGDMRIASCVAGSTAFLAGGVPAAELPAEEELQRQLGERRGLCARRISHGRTGRELVPNAQAVRQEREGMV